MGVELVSHCAGKRISFPPVGQDGTCDNVCNNEGAACVCVDLVQGTWCNIYTDCPTPGPPVPRYWGNTQCNGENDPQHWVIRTGIFTAATDVPLWQSLFDRMSIQTTVSCCTGYDYESQWAGFAYVFNNGTCEQVVDAL